MNQAGREAEGHPGRMPYIRRGGLCEFCGRVMMPLVSAPGENLVKCARLLFACRGGEWRDRPEPSLWDGVR